MNLKYNRSMKHKDDKTPILFLIADVHRQVATAFANKDDLNITRNQAKVLLSVWRNQGPTQKQVASRLSMQSISVSRLVDDLEIKGLVKRQQDPADRRKNRLYITEKTKPIIAKIRTQLDAITDDLLAPLNQAERQILNALLVKIIA